MSLPLPTDPERKSGQLICRFPNCGLTFRKKRIFRDHVNLHLTSKESNLEKYNSLWRCKLADCGKTFALRSRLTRHEKTHEGYTCVREENGIPCGVWFGKFSALRRHMKDIHKPKCDICDKRFSTPSNYKQHMQLHNTARDQFFCTQPDCNRVYSKKSNLSQHIRVYHEQKLYTCSFSDCDSKFATKQAWSRHVAKHKTKSIDSSGAEETKTQEIQMDYSFGALDSQRDASPFSKRSSVPIPNSPIAREEVYEPKTQN